MFLYKTCFLTKSGKCIYNPTDECREYGRKLVDDLRERWAVPKYIYNLKNKSHLDALKVHVVKNRSQKTRWFSYFDISNFFGSVTKNKIVRALKPYFEYDLALEYASNSVVRNKAVTGGGPKYVLPFGFIQSTMLAALVRECPEFCVGVISSHHFLEEHAYGAPNQTQRSDLRSHRGNG